MGGFVSREEGRESGEREVDTGEGDKVGLEFVEIDVQGTIETEGCGDRGDDLSNQAVEVRVAWLGNTKALLANVEDGLVINLNRKTPRQSR